MVTQHLRCSRCDSTDVIRHGKDRKGIKRYRCRACAYTLRENPKPRGYTEPEKQQILSAYRERMILRGLTRVFGDRNERTCRRLWKSIPEDFRRVTCFSDFWEAYRSVIPDEQHEAVNKERGETNHVER